MNTTCPDRASESSRRRTSIISSSHRAIHVTAPQEVELPVNAVWGTDARRELAIECLSGELWVTQAGDWRDVILEQGQTFAAARGGRVAVQAIKDSRLRVRPA